MDPLSLVFGVGDRVAGHGRLVTDADGCWLDLARIVLLGLPPSPRRRSPHAVRLVGAPTDGAGVVTVRGVWLGAAVEVVTCGPGRLPPPVETDWTTPPCPPPPGGWPRGDRDENLDFDRAGLEDLGAAVAWVTFRPSPRQAVLVVAASDRARVEAALRPQLGDRLCVVPSRWTRGQLDAVRDEIIGRWDDWAVESVGDLVDDRAQPCVEVALLRVTAELAAWAGTLPPGLLALTPYLTPDRCDQRG